MHTPRVANGPAVWDPSQEVAAAIRRAAANYANGLKTSSTLGRLRGRTPGRTRVAIIDDSPMYLSGLERAFMDLGMVVTIRADDAHATLHSVEATDADILIIDVAQPPTFTVEGIVAAVDFRRRYPGFPTLLLSTNVDVDGACALAALESDCRSLGYLDKDRLTGGAPLLSAIVRLIEGGTVVDPDVVSTLLARSHQDSILDSLSTRERQTLELVAQGLTNSAIAHQMFLSQKTVETNIASLFGKLGLPPESSANRRVLATLTYLKASQGRLSQE